MGFQIIFLISTKVLIKLQKALKKKENLVDTLSKSKLTVLISRFLEENENISFGSFHSGYELIIKKKKKKSYWLNVLPTLYTVH
jgi:hypothetical protein